MTTQDGNPGTPDPQSEYFIGGKDQQRECVDKLLRIVCRFSERPESSAEERFRWMQARLNAAMVARVFGMMDRRTFNGESGRYTQAIAAAMGGQAFVMDDTSLGDLDLPDTKS